ncbi:MAG: LemA family protein [Endomicrobiales bacterium]
MMMFVGAVLFVGAGLVVALAVMGVALYNALIRLKVDVDRSWSNIEVLQKQRYDEIPNLVRVCEGYMKHERETLEKVTAARTRFLEAKTPGQVAQADAGLTGALKSLFAVAEQYPTLKANETFLQLQGRVSYLENQIADRRESYNSSVAIFNTRIKQIPDALVAMLLGYRDREMYAIADAEKQAPRIAFDFPK